MACVKRFTKIKNFRDDRTFVDTLHQKAATPLQCMPHKCMGSLMSMLGQRTQDVTRTRDEILEQARDFMDQYYTSIEMKNTSAHQNRLSEIQEAVENTGTYNLTTAELTFGCKLAWRNAPRCIGRIQWSKLQVFDARQTQNVKEMFEALCNHIKYASNSGNLRSTVTVFPQRKEGRGDFRVWNSQLIRYAGYKMEDGKIIGDPANVHFTDLCVKLGWNPKYGMFDVLPLVLSDPGSDPEWFEIPPELVLEVNIRHPKYPWFADLGLKWYALPAVANMLFDCGGLEFPACPFSGWYMGTEIGARDLCDKQRYNMLEPIAIKMGLNTQNSSSLWKDRALVEVNIAVLYSFQSSGVSITDHHAASESFIKHMENEQKLRGGCPADWVWVVPPMSGSIMEVFHQEMLLYKLKPSYEYQDDAWKTHVWKNEKNNPKKQKKLIGFKGLAKAVRFSVMLMGTSLSKRVKCSILYATETGKSERFARTLYEMFKQYFNAKVLCMDGYDVSSLEHESLVLVVTSTFGNGEPPENGQKLLKSLLAVKSSDSDLNCNSLHSTYDSSSTTNDNYQLDLVDKTENSLARLTRPLIKFRFSVFALGSKAYPHFAAFGHYIDRILDELGAERIFPIGAGDELCGQEQSFRTWAQGIFKAACETFGLSNDVNINEVTGALNQSHHSWSSNKFRVTAVDSVNELDICEALSKLHNKKILPCVMTERVQLQSPDSDRQTILVKLSTLGASELSYLPGDHLGIFPANSPDLVDSVLARLHNAPSADQVIRTEHLKEVSAPLGSSTNWKQFEKLPVCSLRTAFTYFLDITTPPSQAFLYLLAKQATEQSEKERLETLATDSKAYEEWRYDMCSNVPEVLEQFPSTIIPPSLLLTQLPLLQQRYYSISSSPQMCPGEIHATIAVVRYRTQDGIGSVHEGVCSSWLNKCTTGNIVPCLVRPAPKFHLPDNTSLPIILIGSGTGIAPFRSFWQQRMVEIETTNVPSVINKKNFGDMVLYFGCRTARQDNIYGKELEDMEKAGVLTNFYVALSREPDLPKLYIQDMLYSNGPQVYETLVKNNGHFYVCGDVSMAQDVTSTLEVILQEQGNMDAETAVRYLTNLRQSNRFHEDIFGVSMRKSGEPRRSKDQTLLALEYLTAAIKAGNLNVLRERAKSIVFNKNLMLSKEEMLRNDWYSGEEEEMISYWGREE